MPQESQVKFDGQATEKKSFFDQKDRLVRGLGLLPQNILSYITGRLVRLRFPKPIQSKINQYFIWIFGIDMTEASKPTASYASIEDIFTRELSPNKRLVTGPYVASADGILELSRSALAGEDAVQAKGLTYSLGELIFGQKADPGLGVFAPRWFTTVYLAPHNYHRVHAPVSGQVLKIRYIPGRLWPVNRPAVRAISRLFCRNERLVFDCQLENGAKVWVVMVGAFNVGRMVTRLSPDFVTNSLARQFNGSQVARELTLPDATTVAVGDELGIFMLGSTTVVVMDELAVGTLKPREILCPEAVSMGHSLSV